ncbi:FecR domain-containing protein [Pseudothauera nasutitermitis]|nr:FecR domain-containing protein [Pseudothauera nasutitermitis]
MSKPSTPIEEAAFWYACLHAGDATERERGRWQQWLDGNPANQRAWARIQEVHDLFARVPGKFAAPLLEQKKVSRRAVLRSVVVALGAGLAGVETYRHFSWHEWRADLRTAVGERRREVLADGSLLYLNTGTAVDVAFDQDERRILLHAGEILVETRPDNLPGVVRPFSVHTPHGRVRALGTRFVVRLYETHSSVQVLQDAVEIRPALSVARPVRLAEGQGMLFDRHGVKLPQPLPTGAGAWSQGRLSAVDMRLQEFLSELARYRTGYLGCAPEAADLRVSGVFPLDDPEEALNMLVETFPVTVRRLTRYWARVELRDARNAAHS